MNTVISLFESERARLTTHSDNGDDLEGTYAAYVRTATNEKGVVRSYISSCNIEVGLKLRGKIDRLLTEQFGGKEIE